MTTRACFVLAIVSLATAAYAASPVTDFIAAADHLQLAPNAAPVRDVEFSIGHMKVKLASGSAARLLAGNEPVGFFFKGSGSFVYETTDVAELPVVSHNVKAVAHTKMVIDASHAVLSDDFAEVLIVGGGVAMPDLSGTGGAALGEALQQHEALFTRLRIAPRSHVLAAQKFSFPSSKVVQMEFAGGKDNILYAYDGAEDHDEGIYAVHPPLSAVEDRRLAQRLRLTLLSAQPVGYDRTVTPPPPFALSAIDYTLTGTNDDAKLEITETITRATAGQNVLRFAMRDEEFVKLGAPFRNFHVRAVTDDQGRPLVFDHQRNDLVVAVDGLPGQQLKLKFSIDGDFLVREGGDNAWQLPIGVPWFPLPRQWAGQAFTVHSIVKVKKPFVAFAPGNTIGRREEGDYNVVENVVDKPVQFTMVQAGKYSTYEEKRGDRTIRVATYGLPNQRASKQLTDLAFGLIEYFEFFLGPFPFNEFNIIQVNTYGYGQAPPGTMFITNEAFNPTLTEIDQLFSEGINERFAHEIAHQYWAYVVRMPRPEEQWLTESFAEYSAALALKKFKGDAVYNRLVSTWKGRARDGMNIAPIPYANRIGGDARMSFAQRNSLLYAKGPYLLYALHKELGDTTFLTFLKSYQRSFQWKAGTTKDIAGLLQFMTKKDYKPFFEQYFWGTQMPQ